MTTPLSDRQGGLGQRRAHRLSRRFAGVGVHVSAERLRQLAAGAPATEAERVDVIFALAVCDLDRPDLGGRPPQGRLRTLLIKLIR